MGNLAVEPKPVQAYQCVQYLEEAARQALRDNRLKFLGGIEDILIEERYPRGKHTRQEYSGGELIDLPVLGDSGLLKKGAKTPEKNYGVVADKIIQYLANHPDSEVKDIKNLERHKNYIIRRIKEWTPFGDCTSGKRFVSDTIATVTGAMAEGVIYQNVNVFAPGF